MKFQIERITSDTSAIERTHVIYLTEFTEVEIPSMGILPQKASFVLPCTKEYADGYRVGDIVEITI